MKWLTKNAVLFSVKTCIAAFLALYIALELNLDKPAWSMVSVYVISQLYSASTLSKATYRFLGTVLGGVFIFLVYPFTVTDPVLFSLSVSLWVAFCLYLSLHDRTPKGYVFMLAGYSAAIMGFADVDTPLSITYTVISRVEEITVAIVCSSLIHMLVFPVRMRSLLENSVNNWYESAKKLCNELLTVNAKGPSPEREHILVQMANYPVSVEALITHCVFEGDSARRLIRLVMAQYQHLSYLIPTLTAIEKRLNLLAEQEIPFPDFVSATFSQFLLWLNSAELSGNAQGIQNEIRASQDKIKTLYENGDMTPEEGLLFTGLLERLQNFVHITESYYGVTERVSQISKEKKRGKLKLLLRRHTDEGMIMLSAFSAFAATMVGCLFWIGTGWRDGASAPMMAAVICSFFASLDSPIASIKVFLKGVLIAIIISVIYAVVFIPMAVTFESLIICLAPGLLALGLVIANPSTNFIGLIIATQIPGFIGMSHDFKPDLLVIVNAAISTIVGIVIALLTTALIRNKRPSWTAKRALRKGIKELLQFTSEIKINASSLLARQQYVGSMLDKVNIILPRNKVDPSPQVALGGNLITEIWLGVNCYDFYARHQDILKHHALGTEVLMFEINKYIRHRLKNIYIGPPDSLLNELNQVLLRLESLCRSDIELFTPLFHLFNIRMALYPTARWPEAA
ncbi:fusaric acid resistance protein [Rahnella victoriana]|uniref:FUSC family protein n=1 Tax=Rahnella victoriana TaxID=1510570 RepID=UPI000BB1EBE7|nr:FUSC family protein [Rahnella victoriana]PBI79053.1 fusaric acid resistance protein [Rahnella victoriana]